MNAPMRVLGEASSYDDLIVICRDRADELGLTRMEIDRLGGLADGHAGKLLCLSTLKKLGHVSLGPMMGTLALRFVVVADDEQAAKILERREPRQRPVRTPQPQEMTP